MNPHRALVTIFIVSICGLLFSGYLSYFELFKTAPGASCPTVGPADSIFGYPACVYGFFMYMLVAIISLLGLLAKNNTQP